MKEYIYPAIFHKNDDGSFTVTFPDLPGCITEGKTMGDAIKMAQSALTQWIEFLRDEKEDIPIASEYDAVEKADGEAIGKIPVISKTQLAENLIGAGERLESFGDRRVKTRMQQLVDQQSSCIRPFVDNIETIGRLYNRPMVLVFNGEDLYLGEAAEA